ncbi:glycosyltransferase family 2 protein [Alloiococcus sp. CFN-8]|uniref:glycosyltransferase family 2 protein n=1 Tax=Alloiococcus sp. CFN-8 TaxID=3416081 RepID=UPI003CF627C8
MSLISIIVPIYNVEQYLKRCIDSILVQTYTNFELILVDDGSPDSSGNICDEYARKDPRVLVIHKSNGGLSDARNAGLRIAKGDYIAFVDSDDWVAPTFLEYLLNALKKSDSDICECDVIRTTGSSFVPKNIQHEEYENYTPVGALKLLIQDRVFHQYVWNKLYTKSCLQGIYFEIGKTNEDEFWTYKVFGRARKITKIFDVLYLYFQRENSIMSTSYNIKRLDALEAKVQRQQYITEFFPELSIVSKDNLYSSCIYNGQMTLKYLNGSEQEKAKKIIYEIAKLYRPTKNDIAILVGSEKIWIQLAKFDFWGTCALKNFLKKGF